MLFEHGFYLTTNHELQQTGHFTMDKDQAPQACLRAMSLHVIGLLHLQKASLEFVFYIGFVEEYINPAKCNPLLTVDFSCVCLFYHDYFGSWPVLVILWGIRGLKITWIPLFTYRNTKAGMGTAPCPECSTGSAPQAEALEQPSAPWPRVGLQGRQVLSNQTWCSATSQAQSCSPLWLVWDGLHPNEKQIMKNQLNSQLWFFIKLNSSFFANPTWVRYSASVSAKIFHCWGQNSVYAISPSTSFSVQMRWL